MSDLDPFAILAALGLDDVQTAVPVTTGFGSTALFRVEHAGGTRVLRVFRPGGGFVAERELAAMAAARTAGLPVPAIEARGEWSGRPVGLLEWCDGVTMLAEVRRRPWRALALGRLLGQLQARLHAAPLPDDRHAFGHDWIGRFGEVDPLLRRRLTEASDRQSLLHLDLHPDNVLVHRGGVACLIDWENAMIGDPRADLARTWSLLRLAPAPPQAPRWAITTVRRMLEVGWRRGYRAVAGRPGDFLPFQAWAAAVMVDDLAPKLGRPGIWLRPEDLEPIRRVAADLRARSGLDG